MKFTADRRALADAVRLAAVPGVIVMHPVLSGVRLDALEGAVRVSSTNGDLMCAVTVPAEIVEAGTATPSAALFGGFISSTTSERVTVEEHDLGLTATAGETVASLRCHHPSAWPRIDDIEGEPVALSPEDVEAITHITHAAIRDPKQRITYPQYASVHLAGHRAEATDRYRISVALLDSELPETIVPLDTMTRVLKGAEDGCSVTVVGQRVRFQTDSAVWTSTTIASEFPSFEAPIAAIETPFHLTFDRDELAASLARIGLVDDDTHHVSVLRDGGKAILSNHVLDVGEITDVVTCSGDFDERLILDRKMLAETLTAVEDTSITLSVSSPAKPILITSEDQRYTHVLQPVSLTSKTGRA